MILEKFDFEKNGFCKKTIGFEKTERGGAKFGFEKNALQFILKKDWRGTKWNFPLASAARSRTTIFRWRLRRAGGQKFSVGVCGAQWGKNFPLASKNFPHAPAARRGQKKSVGACGAQGDKKFPHAPAARRGTIIFRWRLRRAWGQKNSVGACGAQGEKQETVAVCGAQGDKKIPLAPAARRGTKIFFCRLRRAGEQQFSASAYDAQGNKMTKIFRYRLRRAGGQKFSVTARGTQGDKHFSLAPAARRGSK